MVLDTSAVLAILYGEHEAESFATLINLAHKRLLSAVSLVEAGIAVENRLGPSGGRELDLLLHRIRIQVAPFDEEQAETARVAFRQFGKGRHPAQLNFGDCCAYALCMQTGEPLLFKGDDFSKTGVARVARE